MVRRLFFALLKMGKNEKKTNAVRILDRLKIKYELHTYDVDPEHLSADHVAENLGQDINRVFKTLVLKGNKTGLFVCVIAGNREVDLKKAARASGNKSAEMLPMKDLLPATGYIRGGCTALGMKKNYPVYVSEELYEYDTIYVSAGIRGMQIELSAADYLNATGGKLADLIRDDVILYI